MKEKQPKSQRQTAEPGVGYRNPPVHTQFAPGKSGNPKGRPKGARNLDMLMAEELEQLIQIKEQGVEKVISKGHAIVKALTAKAINGDMRAAATVFAWHDQQASRGTGAAEDLSLEDKEILEALMRRGSDPK